jgi:hypothetical protein
MAPTTAAAPPIWSPGHRAGGWCIRFTSTAPEPPLAQGEVLRPQLLDRCTRHILLLHELCAAVDGGDERRVRDPERGAQVAPGARAVQLGQRLDGWIGERLLAG